jgi:hypothetical protein
MNNTMKRILTQLAVSVFLAAYLNDDVCLSTRMYDRRENTFSIWSDTVGLEFANVTLRVPQTLEKASVKSR